MCVVEVEVFKAGLRYAVKIPPSDHMRLMTLTSVVGQVIGLCLDIIFV